MRRTLPCSSCFGSGAADVCGGDHPGATALDTTHIRQVGLMLADRQAGLFALDIRRISLV